MSQAVKSRGPQLPICGLALRAWPELLGKRVPRKPSENRKQNKDMDFVLRKLCVGSGYQKE